MAIGGAFDREDLAAPMAEINTTPLVDVMLVLLVIFLVTAPMLTNSIKLELPHETAVQVDNKKTVTVSIKSDGQYYWGETQVSDAELDAKLRDAGTTDSKQPLNIRADSGVTYGKVSHVLAEAGKAGLTNIGFITEPK